MSLENISAWYLGLSIWSLALISLWSLVWKGFALWKSAAVKKNWIWFVVLLIVNTFGILEILYIFWFSEIKLKTKGKAGVRVGKVKKRKK